MRVKIKIGELVITISAPTKIEVEVEGVEVPAGRVEEDKGTGTVEPEIESVAEGSPAPAKLEAGGARGEERREAEEVLDEFFRENDRQATILKSSVEERREEEEDANIRQALEELLGG